MTHLSGLQGSLVSAQDNYRSELSKYLKGQYVELYWKARVGLYALLKSFGVTAGDEVVLPAFTCVVVPNAVLYLGAKPVYVDIEKDSFSSPFKAISSVVTKNTKVIICQNTFGLSFELEEIVSFAKSKGIFTVEDCTHGFGGTYNGRPNGTFCDAAIYSSQWNKPFSTGIGGFVSVEDPGIVKNLAEVSALAQNPSPYEQLQLFFLYLSKQILVNRYTYWSILKLYRLLSSKGIVVGSSSPEELISTEQAHSYFKKSGIVQSLLGIRALKKIKPALMLRKKNAEIYSKALSRLGKNHVDSKYSDNHSFLVYPLLVHDKIVFRELAEKNRIMLGDWFSSPLHPIDESLEQWGFDIELFPVARYCSEHIVNLPTNISDPTIVTRFLERHPEQLVDG